MDVPLVFVFVAATVATLAVLGWALAANCWRVPRWGQVSIASVLAPPPVDHASTAGVNPPVARGAQSPGACRD